MSAKAKNKLTPQQRKATLNRVLHKIRPYSAFVVCSLVGGILNKKVDPVKTMIYCTPMAIYFLVIGVAFFFI